MQRRTFHGANLSRDCRNEMNHVLWGQAAYIIAIVCCCFHQDRSRSHRVVRTPCTVTFYCC